MPEGDTIFRTARALHRALAGERVTRLETALATLARVNDDTPIEGRTVESVSARGKWLLMRFSGDLVLLTHMLMSGSWHIYRRGERWRLGRWRMRIVITTERMVAVAFDVPIAEFHTELSLARRKGLAQLGPDLLDAAFDEAEAVQRLRSCPELEIGVALLNQKLMAGVGNEFKSEICFAARVNPFRTVGSLTDAELNLIVRTSAKLLRANVTDNSGEQVVTYTGFRRTTGRSNLLERLWVYGRDGEPCRVCGAALEMRRQGEDARVTFWCPRCQPLRD